MRHVCRHGMAEGCGRHSQVAHGEKKVSKVIYCSCFVMQKCQVCNVHLRKRACRDASKEGVVLVLGCTDWQRSMLYRELHRMNSELPGGHAVALMQRDS